MVNNDKRKNIRRKRWFYTWNNPNRGAEDHHASFADVTPAYHVFQKEVGESGTPHYQGYLEFDAVRGWSSLMACNPQVVYLPAQGSQEQCTAYCTKADTREAGPWTFGAPVVTKKGGMSPDFLVQIQSGKRLRDLAESHVDDVRKYPRFYQEMRRLFPPPARGTAPEVVLLYGPPGTGKTRYVRENEPVEDLFIKPVDKSFWMDGYDGHPAVLLDDFAGAANHISLTNLLQLIDRYQTQVPVKGGFTWWQPERIYVTTNIHPANWYRYDERMCHYQALVRRFTAVRVYTVSGVVDYKPSELDSGAWDTFWNFQSNVQNTWQNDS